MQTHLKQKKLRSYSDQAIDLPESGSNYIYCSVILNDTALKKDENYYPQVFLKECKYIEKKGH